MSGREEERPCLFYAAGPGDVVKTFIEWQSQRDDSHQVAVTYSGQFFELCRSLGFRGVVVSSNPRAEVVSTAQFHVENRPKPAGGRGIAYHLRQVSYLWSMIRFAKKEKARAMIVSDATGHLFPLGYLGSREMAIIPSLHCTLWPLLLPARPVQRLCNRLSRRLYTHRALGILTVSREIQQQLEQIAGGATRPVYRFRPVYRPETFASLPAPQLEESQFHLLFAGRMEENKGVFDLLAASLRLAPGLRHRLVWHLAGDGAAEQSLRSQARKLGVDSNFLIHGYCHRDKMQELIARAHAFIVPTRADFEEGFNKVVAEAILSGRPVIASSACPANSDVRPALLEVEAGDIDGYCRAIERLAGDRQLYRQKQQACAALQQQFYAPGNSWSGQLLRLLTTCPALTDQLLTMKNMVWQSDNGQTKNAEVRS